VTRLAIIDDHELVREGLKALLASESVDGYAVVYCGQSVAEAIDSGVDVALLDVELGSDQPDVATSCRTLVAAGVGVLLISAYDEQVSIRAGLSSGALGFVPKRVSLDDLREALRSVAADEVYLSVDLAAMLASGPEVPDLSPRERDALRLYASGLKLAAVARRMEISPHTVKEYLDRVRAKYQQVGRPARTRTELYAEASRDGLLLEPLERS
jgi:DNA-binding NarL/FixJ family response regulator